MKYFEANYKIVEGISEKNIKELILFSRQDEEVLKFTGDRERFANREKFDQWCEKGRYIYTLVDQEGKLGGIVWFGEKEGAWTLAIRMYGAARGRDWSHDFLFEPMKKLMERKVFKTTAVKDWWLECSENNMPARKLYEKMGFKLSGKGKEEGKIIYRRSHDFGSEKKN